MTTHGYSIFRVLALGLLLFLMAGYSLSGQIWNSSGRIRYLNASAEITTSYDNNILKYSQKYLDRFMHNEDEGRFHIKTQDDLILGADFGINTGIRIHPKYLTRVYVSAERQQYLVNDIRSWNSFGLALEQSLPRNYLIRAEWTYIPQIYIRHYRDKEWVALYGYFPETFQAFSYSKQSIGGYLQKTLKTKTRIRIYANRSQYFHNKHFTEYNSVNYSTGLGLKQQITKKLSADAGFQVEQSTAKGYDASYQTLVTSNGPDASYNEFRFSTGFELTLPAWKKLSHALEGDYTYRYRRYSSSYGPDNDYLHAGRIDYSGRMLFKYAVRVSKNIKTAVFYQWNYRTTWGRYAANRELISEEKDFSQHLWGLGFIFNQKIIK